MRHASLSAVVGLFSLLFIGGPAWAEGGSVTLLANAAVPGPSASQQQVPRPDPSSGEWAREVSADLKLLESRLPRMSQQDKQRVRAVLEREAERLGELSATLNEPHRQQQWRINEMMGMSGSAYPGFGHEVFRDARRHRSGTMSSEALLESVKGTLDQLDRKRYAIVEELRRRQSAPGVGGLRSFASDDTRALLDDLCVLDEFQAGLLLNLSADLDFPGNRGNDACQYADRVVRSFWKLAKKRAARSAELLRANENAFQRVTNKVLGTNGPALYGPTWGPLR